MTIERAVLSSERSHFLTHFLLTTGTRLGSSSLLFRL
jgi:hypothetical protein